MSSTYDPSRHYEIHSLSDILRKFRMELDIAVNKLNQRIDGLEEEINKIKGIEAQTGEHEQGGTTEIQTDEVRLSYRRTLIKLRYLNIALRGYHSLLRELGLPKEASAIIKHFEDLEMAIMRIIQMLYFMRTLIYAQMGPLGWIILGGMLAGSIAYFGRSTGGF